MGRDLQKSPKAFWQALVRTCEQQAPYLALIAPICTALATSLTKIKSICKLDATDQFNLILKVLKDLEIFKSDANYDIEYGKLDHNSLGLPNLIELKNRYRKIFDTKTWYEILGLKFDYSTLDEARIFFQDNKCKKIDEKTYNKLRRKNNRLPKYPLEYYKKSNISKYDDLILNVDYMLI